MGEAWIAGYGPLLLLLLVLGVILWSYWRGQGGGL